MRITKNTYDDLFDFQKDGVDFLSSRRSALLADQVGTGKTAQALLAAQTVSAKTILVICTASIKYNWKKEAIKWGYDERDIYILDKKNVETLPEDRGMFIINYDNIWRKPFTRYLGKRTYDVLIADECHNLKNHKAKRSKSVWMRSGYVDLASYRWFLTATPILNRPVDLFPLLNKCCPDRLDQYAGYIEYTKRYCNAYQGKWGWDVSGADNLDELAGRLNGFMLRRTRESVMGEKTLQKIYFPITDEIKQYLFTSGENDSIRRKIGIGKIGLSAEYIETILESENKVVVFAYHKDVITGLQEKLKTYNPVLLYGETLVKNRQPIIEQFQSDPETRVFIGQIKSAGEGIDGLQHVANVAVFVEICHTPGIILQAMGRLARQGQTKKCLFQFLTVEGTIDEKVIDGIMRKERNIKQVMQDDKTGIIFNAEDVHFVTPAKQEEPEEVVMSIEQNLERIATALESIANSLNAEEPILEFPKVPVEFKPLSEKQEKILDEIIRSKPVKEKVAKKPAPALFTDKEIEKAQNIEYIKSEPTISQEEYKGKITEIVNEITQFHKDSDKKNAMFAEFSLLFKTKYPKTSHVMTVEPKDYNDVIALLNNFLKEKGVVK